MELFLDKPFDFFIDKLKNNNNFRYSRFNDGEYNAIIGNNPNRSNCDGHQYFSEMGVELKNILLNYVYSDDYIVETYDLWYNTLPHIKNIVDSIKEKNNNLKLLKSDFIRISHENEPNKFKELLDVLKNRNVVVVGPSYLQKLNKFFNFRYIGIPLKNCYLDKDNTIKKIKDISDVEENTVFLFSASMPTKIMIDFFKGNKNTYIDWGSVWDTFFVSKEYSFIRKRSTSNLEKYKEIYKDFLI